MVVAFGTFGSLIFSIGDFCVVESGFAQKNTSPVAFGFQDASCCTSMLFSKPCIIFSSVKLGVQWVFSLFLYF